VLNTNELKELMRPVIAGWLTGFALQFVLFLLFHSFFLTFVVAPAAGFFLSFRLASGLPARQYTYKPSARTEPQPRETIRNC